MLENRKSPLTTPSRDIAVFNIMDSVFHDANNHGIPLGSLVEIKDNGLRLFVVYRGQDSDGTPLYWLSINKNDTLKADNFAHRRWAGGYSESGLIVIR